MILINLPDLLFDPLPIIALFAFLGRKGSSLLPGEGNPDHLPEGLFILGGIHFLVDIWGQATFVWKKMPVPFHFEP